MCASSRGYVVASFLLLALPLTVRAADEQPAWPQENGPFGNFNPRQYGVKLVDDPAQIKMVWVSEEHDLGMGRAGTEGFHRLKFKGVTPGTSTGLILAEGKVFASSSVPTGTVWAVMPNGPPPDYKDGDKNTETKLKATSEQIEAYKLNSRIDADDFTVAIDMKTGKTVWKSVEAGKGINVYPGKRSDAHNTPVYYQGKIFSLGTTGLVYCYDAATGKKLWEDNTGSDVKPMAALKAKCLQDRTLPGGMGKAICPVVAEGVLIMPQYGKGHDIPLRGMDVITGKTLWETTDGVTGPEATPAVWRYQRKQYLVVGNLNGELRLIDPKDGKVLWAVTGLPPQHHALTTSEKHVITSVYSKTAPRDLRSGKIDTVLTSAYRITPEKAEFVWAAPDEPEFYDGNKKDACSIRKHIVRDGFVYDTSSDRELKVFKEETGEPVKLEAQPRFGWGVQHWLIEDRLLLFINPSHKQSANLEFWTADPKDMHKIASYWPEHARVDGGQMAAGYDVLLELPYADGFFFMRGYRGTVVCYDLRKTPAMLKVEAVLKDAKESDVAAIDGRLALAADADPSIRCQATLAITPRLVADRLADRKSKVLAALASLSCDADAEVLAAAAPALGCFGAESLDIVAANIKNPSVAVRQGALRTLGLMKDVKVPRVNQTLAAGLADRESDVVLAALDAAKARGADATECNATVAVLVDSSNAVVARHAIESLLSIGQLPPTRPKRLEAALVEMLGVSDQQMAMRAVAMVRALGDDEAMRIFAAVLKGDNVLSGARACHGLAAIGKPAAPLLPLTELAHRKDVPISPVLYQ